MQSPFASQGIINVETGPPSRRRSHIEPAGPFRSPSDLQNPAFQSPSYTPADPTSNALPMGVSPTPYKDNKRLDTFSEAGKSIFVAACLLAIHRGTANLGDVNKIVAGGEYKNAQYKTYADEAEEAILRELWTNAASASSRLLTSNIQALMTAGLKQWDNLAVRSATQGSDFDFATFRQTP